MFCKKWLTFPDKYIVTLAACLLDAEERSHHMVFNGNKGTPSSYASGKQQHKGRQEKLVASLLEFSLHLGRP